MENKENAENSKVISTFNPIPSLGGIWSWVTLILTVGLFLFIAIPLWNTGIGCIMILFALVMGVLFGVMVYGFYNMAFILTDEGLMLRWAFFNRVIPYNSIQTIGTTTSKILDGVRVGGIGMPGYLLGKFKLMLDGELQSVSLYATKITHTVLVYVKKSNGIKCYGLTPEDHEGFVQVLKEKAGNPEVISVNPKTEIIQDPTTSAQYQTYAKIVYIMCLGIMLSTVIYMLVNISQLPDTNIPMHWGVDGQVDRWGAKADLIWYVAFTLIFGGVLTNVLYYYVCKKSELGKTKWGYSIMILPLSIIILFLIISIQIIRATFASL